MQAAFLKESQPRQGRTTRPTYPYACCSCLADVGAARDRFLEENILAATLSLAGVGSTSTSPASSTPATSSPATAHTPSASPDLLVHKPLPPRAHPGKSMIPVKKPSPAAVNKAFIMGAEAFAGKPITVQRALGATGGLGVARAAGSVQRVRECDVSGSGAASPRMVQLGGFTPRVKLRERGRTESKQTIISSDTDSMTAVCT